MRASQRHSVVALGLTVLGSAACGPRSTSTAPVPAPPAARAPMFTDAAAEAGLAFNLGHGGRTPLSILDTASGGCAFFDFDLDGNLDAVLAGDPQCRVFRNQGQGSFEDVTASLGIPKKGPWMGCAVGDYDGDGYPDLLLTGYRVSALLQNQRGKRFVDRTVAAGLSSRLWTTSADFADVDRDGDLDLYVGAYVDYRKGKRDTCLLGSIQTACGPEVYSPERGRFYRNIGRGRFRDETKAAGLDAAAGKTWGALFTDFDGDGWPDLYLANDMVACNLFRNTGTGRFADIGLSSGTAYDSEGRPMGAMGVDWGDTDGDRLPDLFVATYAQQPDVLFRGLGEQLLRSSSASGISGPTRPYVGFGGGFIDVDNDGDLDLFIANGHIRDNIRSFDPSQDYAQPMQLLLNRGDGSFEDAGSAAGPPFSQQMVGRGVAFGDYDRDGDTDILVVDLEGAARLLRNELGNRAGQWLRIRLVGLPPNREAFGALVTIRTPDRQIVRLVKRGGSVLSSHDVTVLAGLGSSTTADVRVRWPDNSVSAHPGLRSGTSYTVAAQGRTCIEKF